MIIEMVLCVHQAPLYVLQLLDTPAGLERVGVGVGVEMFLKW